MKRKSSAPKRDLTGLACAAAMGLLVLVAWAALPAMPVLVPSNPAERTSPVRALAQDTVRSTP